MTRKSVATQPARSKRTKAPKPNGAPALGPDGKWPRPLTMQENDAAVAALPDDEKRRLEERARAYLAEQEAEDGSPLANFLTWEAKCAEDDVILRREVELVRSGEEGDATLEDLVFTLAGGQSGTVSVADAACYVAGWEIELIRVAIEAHDLARTAGQVPDTMSTALSVTLAALSSRLHAAGEIERRRIAASKGEVKP